MTSKDRVQNINLDSQAANLDKEVPLAALTPLPVDLDKAIEKPWLPRVTEAATSE